MVISWFSQLLPVALLSPTVSPPRVLPPSMEGVRGRGRGRLVAGRERVMEGDLHPMNVGYQLTNVGR
jgi:hypothetical protein